ncbi:MAG: hypothetical protein H6704_23845 [Myxococcales bacterium]|nr:hypothetical protein [Myxococcales bacterium]
MSAGGAATLEWAAVGPDAVVVATPQRAWLHRPDPWAADPFRDPMTHAPGDRAATGWLLEGAVAVGVRAAGRAPAPPPLSRLRWVWRLAGLYHLTTHTPGLLRAAEAKFRAAGRDALADWAADKARDEAGHDRLALRDLRALGLPAEAVVEALKPPVAQAMVARFRAAAADDLPLGVVAYAHAVERLALRADAAYVARVQACMPRGVDATRCLRVHSAAGTDAGHVEDNVALVAGLPAAERSRIALAVRDVAQVSSTPSAEGHVSDAWLAGVLETLGEVGQS